MDSNELGNKSWLLSQPMKSDDDDDDDDLFRQHMVA